MALLPVTSLSAVARQIRSYLASCMAEIQEGQIYIGHPKKAAEIMDNNNSNLNLFIYRIDHGGFYADLTSDDPLYVKLFCMITAFGTDETAGDEITVSAGENSLRLTGEVMRCMHENPLLMLHNAADEPVAQLQIIFHPLSMDDINHIWSTQGDTAYRLSLAYEITLVPVPLAVPLEKSPRVGGVGSHAASNPQPGDLDKGLPELFKPPLQVPKRIVNTVAQDWHPHICFCIADQLAYSLTLELAALPAVLTLLTAGKKDTGLAVVYEKWDAVKGWLEMGAIGNVICDSPVIDPEQIVPAEKKNINNPLADTGQIMLYAVRQWQVPGTGNTIDLKSNPLLLTIYKEEGV